MSAMHSETTASKIEPKSVSTTVDLVIRLQVAGVPADVERYRAALEALAEVMAVQAEEGLWSLGYDEAETDDGDNELIAEIDSALVQSVLIHQDGVQ